MCAVRASHPRVEWQYGIIGTGHTDYRILHCLHAWLLIAPHAAVSTRQRPLRFFRRSHCVFTCVVERSVKSGGGGGSGSATGVVTSRLNLIDLAGVGE